MWTPDSELSDEKVSSRAHCACNAYRAWTAALVDGAGPNPFARKGEAKGRTKGGEEESED